LAAALQSRFGCLPAAAQGAADLTFTFDTVGDPSRHVVDTPPDAARPVYTSKLGDVLYDDDTDSLFVTCGDRIRLRCDPASGVVRVSIAQGQSADSWLLSHPLVTLPLMELAKRRGLFTVHAAGMAIDGRCLIFPGTSGSGKSTLSLALARAGWDMMGDDLLFLVPERDRVQALAFPEAIDIAEHTVDLFGELQDLHATEMLPGWPKHQLHSHKRYGTRVAWSCLPEALIFPRVAHQAHSKLTPIGHDEALLELVPNVLLTETSATQSHLDALAALVRQCPCYRLETGRDLDALPAELRQLMGLG
jgi:hypothetical protein